MKRSWKYFLKMISIILLPLKKNVIFFIFIYLLGIITIFVEVQTLHFTIPFFNFLSLILDIYFLCLLLTLFPERFKSFLCFFFSFVAYFLAIVNAFCVEHFSARIGPEILNVILETNPRESVEFADKYITFNLLWSGVGVIALLMLIHMIISFIAINKKLFTTRYHILLQLVFSFLLLTSFAFCLSSRIKVLKLMFVSTAEDADVLISNFSQNTPFNNFIFSIKMREIANNGLNYLADTQEKVKVDSCSYISNKIVLIIGESYIKDHAQLYGYQKNTTPLQIVRTTQMETGRLFPFYDVVSPSNLTSIVFKNVFSLHSLDDKSDWTNYPLFPVLFRKANYRVFFITNQYVQSLNSDIFNLSGGLFLNHSRLNAAQFDFRNTKTHRYDMELLEDFDSLKQFQDNHNLFIFHLAGQHIDFDKRSPKEYKVFNVNDYKNRNDLSKSEKQIVADYDNATFYNDIVVDSIIGKFENDNAIVIYMPDHGEECYDETHRMGRLPSGNYSPEILRQEYRIPFWIWCSKTYIETHHLIVSQIEQASKRPFMTDDLPHLLLYLAGIKCNYYQDRRNLISPSFDVNRKRLINGVCDYDKTCN